MRFFFGYELLNYDIGELGIFCLSYILFKFFLKKIRGLCPLVGTSPLILYYTYIYIYIYIYICTPETGIQKCPHFEGKVGVIEYEQGVE